MIQSKIINLWNNLLCALLDFNQRNFILECSPSMVPYVKVWVATRDGTIKLLDV